MAAFIIPEHPLLTEEERVELQGVFSRFSAAIESPDDDSMAAFFAGEREFFDNASGVQTMIFTLTMQQLGLLTEEEAHASLHGVDVDEFIEVDALEMSDLGFDVSDEGLDGISDQH